MAFRVLTEREISFLDEEERKAYEEAYSIYLERAAFVKRLEELDKVKMPDIVLDKKPVKKIKAPELKKGKLPEYSASVAGSGSDFLNAAKSAGTAFASVGKIKPSSGFSVSLPDVKTNAPEISAVDAAISYKAELPQVSVPAAPKTGRIDNSGFTAQLPPVSVPTVPKTARIKKSEFTAELSPVRKDYETYSKDVNIKPYSVVPTDRVLVAPPDAVSFKSEGKSTAVLPDIKLCAPDAVEVDIPAVKDIRVDCVKTVVPSVIAAVPDKTVVSECSAFTAAVPKIECAVPQRNGVNLPAVTLSAAPEISANIPLAKSPVLVPKVFMPQEESVSNKITDVKADLSTVNAVLPAATEISNNVPKAKADISAYIPTVPSRGKVYCNINVSKTELDAPKSIGAPKVSVSISAHALEAPAPSFVPEAPEPAAFKQQTFEVKQTVLPKIQIPVIDRSSLNHIIHGI